MSAIRTARYVIVFKRSMARVMRECRNPLFFKENTAMLLGAADGTRR